MKKTTLLLLATAILACKKDKKEESQFPATLYSEKVEVSSETRAFTKSGEVKDPKQIAALTGKLSYFRAEDSQENIGTAYLTFNSKDSATFANDGFKYAITQSGNQFLLTSSARSVSPKPFLDHFRFHLPKYENVVAEGNGEIRKEVRIAYGNYKELKVSVFAYALSTSPRGVYNEGYKLSGMIINEFNMDVVLPMLGTYDTIAVKTYNLTIKAR